MISIDSEAPEASPVITSSLDSGDHDFNCSLAESSNYNAANDSMSYSVGLANSSVAINIVGSQVYGESLTITCTPDPGDLVTTLKIDGEIVTEGAQDISATEHLIRCDAAASATHSAATNSSNITITKATGKLNLTVVPTSPQTYGTAITPTCTVDTGIGTPALTINGTPATNGAPVTLAAGFYEINCTLGESENYTSASNGTDYTITKASPVVSTILTNPSPTYGETTNISCEVVPSLSTQLYLDDTPRAEGEFTLTAGSHNATCVVAASENYTSGRNETIFSVAKANAIVDISADPPSSQYGEEITVSCSILTGVGTAMISIDSAVSEPSPVSRSTLSVDTHEFNCSLAESSNYNAANDSMSYSVGLANSSVAINIVGSTVYGESLSITCTPDPGDLVTTLKIDGEIVTEGAQDISATEHLIRCDAAASATHSAATNSTNITITKAIGKLDLTVVPASPQTYGTAITPTCTIDTGIGTPSLTIDGSPAVSGTLVTLAADDHDINCTLSESENYTSAANSTSYTINKAASTISVETNESSPVEFNTSVNFTCNVTPSGLTPVLRIDGTPRGQGAYTLLPSDHDINCSTAGNENYSASSDEEVFVVLEADQNVSAVIRVSPSSLSLRGTLTWTINVTNTGEYGANVTIAPSWTANFTVELGINESNVTRYSQSVSCPTTNVTRTVTASISNDYGNASDSDSATARISCVNPTPPGSCRRDWYCGDWSACANGIQTRDCHCGCPDDDDCRGDHETTRSCNLCGDVTCEDDNNPCTDVSCIDGICVIELLSGNSCDDGDICTTGDYCEDGICLPGVLSDECINESCDASWECGPWSECDAGFKTRMCECSCADGNCLGNGQMVDTCDVLNDSEGELIVIINNDSRLGGVLDVVVTDKDGNIINDALIRLVTPDGKIVSYNDGFHLFEKGKWTIMVSKEGYASNYETLDIESKSDGKLEVIESSKKTENFIGELLKSTESIALIIAVIVIIGILAVIVLRKRSGQEDSEKQ